MLRARLVVWIFAVVGTMCALALSARPAVAASFSVCTDADLIAAILSSNTNSQDDTIDLGGCTITLNGSFGGAFGPNRLPIILPDAPGFPLAIQNGKLQSASSSPRAPPPQRPSRFRSSRTRSTRPTRRCC